MNYDSYGQWMSDTDKKIVKTSGWGKRMGFGKRPVLMVIDAQNKFVGIDRPILESSEVYPAGIGERAFRAMEKIQLLLNASREKKLLVFYTSGLPAKAKYFDSFAKKIYRPETPKPLPDEAESICSLVVPKEGEVVLYKNFASSFFCSPLISYLTAVGCDTLIVTGFVTSGCIRAFVVDAASYNFNVCVVEDGVADRFEYAHYLNLLDMDMKYADVRSTEEVLEYIADVKI